MSAPEQRFALQRGPKTHLFTLTQEAEADKSSSDTSGRKFRVFRLPEVSERTRSRTPQHEHRYPPVRPRAMPGANAARLRAEQK